MLVQRASRRRLLVTAVMTVIAGASGCALFKVGDPVTTVSGPLKQVTPRIDAIELEVSFVERPIGDPLLGSSLWAELDTVSTLSPQILTSLRRNGFRFGIASSDPPRNLVAALGVAGGTYHGHQYSQRSGQEMTIDTWPVYPRCTISVDEGGETRDRTYDLARCVFRVTPQRLQDGWVRVQFIPEIHHGELKLRPMPGNQAWEQMPSQLIDPLFEQRFTVDLNVGEMVVLAADGDERTSVGHHFFRGGDSENKLQRMLILRVTGMKRLTPVEE